MNTLTEEERRAQDGPECKVCHRTDWAYDAETGMWCVGCGYVEEATGKAWKPKPEGRGESVREHNAKVKLKHQKRK